MNNLLTREFAVRTEDVDAEQRTVTGIAVPWDSPARIGSDYTEVIAKGAVRDSEAALLYWRHDEPIGRIVAAQDTDNGWQITARISETPRGDEAYTLLRDGVIDKFSIGFVTVEHREEIDADGHMTVTRTAINVREVSLVPFPAYQGATVAQVRAEVNEKDNVMPEIDYSADLTEVRTGLEDIERRLDILAEQRDETPQGDVFASFGDLVKRVATGEDVAVRAYEGAVSGDTVLKDAWVGNLVEILKQKQRVAQTFATGSLPSQGMGVEYAVLNSDSTDVGVQAAEGDDLDFGKVSIDVERAGVKTLGGWSSLSRQAIERANVGILDTTFEALAEKYARAVESLARAAFTSGVSGADTIEADLTTQDGIVAALVDLVEEFDDRGRSLDGLFVAKDVFLGLLGVAATDRVLQVSAAPTDKVGSVTVSSLVGDIAGVKVSLLPNATAGLVAAYDRTAIKTLESPGAPIRLQDENVVNLTKDFSVYGYAAAFVQRPDALISVVEAAA